MSNTTHIRIYQTDKERLEELKKDKNIPATISKALDKLEQEQNK